jgi:hypothetical protein
MSDETWLCESCGADNPFSENVCYNCRRQTKLNLDEIARKLKDIQAEDNKSGISGCAKVIIFGILAVLMIGGIAGYFIYRELKFQASRGAQGRYLGDLDMALASYQNEYRDIPRAMKDIQGQLPEAKILRKHPRSHRDNSVLYIRPSSKYSQKQPIFIDNPEDWDGYGCMVVYSNSTVSWVEAQQAKRLWELAMILSVRTAANVGGVGPNEWGLGE